MECKILIDVDPTPLGEAIKKANRLVGLLQEAAQIIDLLGGNNKLSASDITRQIANDLSSQLASSHILE